MEEEQVEKESENENGKPSDAEKKAKLAKEEEDELACLWLAEDVWVSQTNKTLQMVILAKFRNKATGEIQLRTLGKNTFGLLGQGKDIKESLTFKKV